MAITSFNARNGLSVGTGSIGVVDSEGNVETKSLGVTGSITPAASGLYDLGSPTKTWRNLYASTISGSLTGSNLLATQVVVAGMGGILSGTNDLTYDNSNLTISGSFRSVYSSGDEGGELFFTKPQTNTTLNTGVTIDLYRDKIRIFETGGTTRGGYFDISALGAGVATNLYNPIGGSDTYVQFNDGGSLAGDADFTFTKATNLLQVANISGSLTSSNVSAGQVVLAGTGGVISGSNLLYWDNSNSRLGVGTATPGYQLTVNGTVGLSNNLVKTTAVGTGGTILDVDVSSFSGDRIPLSITGHASQAYNLFQIGVGGAGNKFTVDKSGNVGIGTTNTNGNRLVITGGNVSVTGSVLPGVTVTYDLGSTTYYWRDIYARSGSYTGDVSISGNLTVAGTQTIVNSETVNIKDNIILLNATSTPQQFGGIYVADTTANTTGSLRWNSSTDKWEAGLAGSEVALPTGTGTTSYVTRWTGTNTLGTGVLYDDSTNVGISTASPASKLHVYTTQNDATATPSVDINAAFLRLGDGTTGMTFNNGVGIKLHDAGNVHYSIGQLSGSLYISQTSTNGNVLFPGPSGRTDAIVVNSSGQVGVGSTSPVALFNVKGTDTFVAMIAGTTYGAKFTSAGGTGMRVDSTDPTGTSSYQPLILGGTTITLNANANTTAAASLYVASNQNVGIGSTTTVSARLQVSGSSTASTPTMVVREGVVSPTGGAGIFDAQNSAGTSILFVTGSNRVGIGTSGPAQTFEIQNSVNYQFRIGNGASSTNFTYDIGRETAFGYLRFYGNQSNANGYIFDGANGERMRIDLTGNVGIGTSVTSDKLAVNGSMSVTGSVLPGTDNIYNLGSASKRWANVYATSLSGSLTGSNVAAGQVVVAGTGGVISGSNNFWWDNTNQSVGIGTNSVNSSFKLDIIGAARTTANGFYISTNYSAGNNVYRIYDNSGVFQIESQVFGQATSNSSAITFATSDSAGRLERMRISSGGNVGVGTNSYSARFHVSGSSTASTPTMVVREGVVSAAAGAGIFDVQNSAGTSILFVTGSGRVGVGTITPQAAFHVSNGTSPNLAQLYVGYEGSTNYYDANTHYYRNGSTNTRLTINSSGNVTPGTDNTQDLGSSALRWANVFANSVSGSLTGSNVTAGQIVVAGTGGVLSGSNNFWWDNTNRRVGIGTSTLSYPLTVVGPSSTTTTVYIKSPDTSGAATFFGDSSGILGQLYVTSTGTWLDYSTALNFRSGYGGTSRMLIDSSGNVGIGTATVTARLLVSGSSTTTTPTMVVREGVVSPTGGVGTFDVQNSAGTSLLFVSGSGNVGIGTTQPSAYGRLSVAGTQPDIFVYPVGNGGYLRLSANTAEGFIATNQYYDNVAAAVKAATTGYSPQVELFVTDGSIRFTTTTSVSAGSNISGTEVMRITSGASVGIGTTTTGDKLAVNGSMSVTGSLLPGTDNLYNLGSSSKRWANVFATSVSGSLTGSNVSAGQVVVAGTGGVLSGSNNFWWSNSNNRVGIGTSSPSDVLDVNGSINIALGSSYKVGSSGVLDAPGNYTRIISPGTSLSTQGTQVLAGAGTIITTFASNGNVGVGTTNPSARLHVTGSSTASDQTLLVRAGTPNQTGPVFEVENNLGATLLVVSGSGNVGIGTTNPGFNLEVNGTFAAVTKSFVIPHPLKSGWKLRYGSLEGPENGVYVRGQSDSDTIELPDYWVPLVDESSITVHLTPIGKWQSLYVESIENNRIKIGRGLLMRLLGIKPAFFYTVSASRKDVTFEVEYNPSGS